MKITVDTNKLLRQMEILAAVYKRLQVIEDNLTTLGNKKDWEDIYDGIAEHIKHDIYSYSYDVSQFLTVLGGFSKLIEISCSKYNEVDLEISEGKELIAYNDTKSTQTNVSDMTESINKVASVDKSLSAGTTKSVDKISSSNLTVSEKVRLTAVDWAIQIANDDAYGYSQNQENRGINSYDCSSLVCSAFKNAGVDINPLMNTETMAKDGCAALLSAGFVIVTSEVNLQTGEGLKEGDILLTRHIGSDGKTKGHTEIVSKVNNGKIEITGAHSNKDGKVGDSSGKEIDTRKYHYDAKGYGEADKWDYVLRYNG